MVYESIQFEKFILKEKRHEKNIKISLKNKMKHGHTTKVLNNSNTRI